jgi:glutamyl-tRNA synthetase
MSIVRTRFAPSPTGYLHVGGLRTALYCYLLARQHNGQFLLRIEDTDQRRLVSESITNIINGLSWAGVNFDEGPGKEGSHGPYIQSQRLELYKKHAHMLIDNGHAYYCFCSPERLEKVREFQIAAKQPPAYDRACRDLSSEEVQARLQKGEPHVIRMKIPLDGEITFNDLIRGDVTIAYKVVDDQVIIKSDGFPTYHLAATVDDHFMEISHVIRGEEWLPSTPKHLLLYKYFGWQAPLFSHLPLLLNPDKSKLSKRQGDVSVDDYRVKGYLPDAVVNFIAFLGWNPGDTREIFSLEELIKEFSLERVGKAGAVFNIEKLNWLNEQYIHKKTDEELCALVKPFAQTLGVDIKSEDYLKQVIALMKERVTVLPDFLERGKFFFTDPEQFDEQARLKNWTPETAKYLSLLLETYTKLDLFDSAAVEQALRQCATQLLVSAGKLIHPLRLALTGVAQGPSLFHLIEVLGKSCVLRRLAYAIKMLG